MSSQGLSNDKLEQLRKQREEEKAKKRAEAEKLEKEQQAEKQREQEKLEKEQQVQQLKAEKEELKKEKDKLKEEKNLLEKEKLTKERDESAQREKEKEKQIKKLEKEKQLLEQEKKRLEKEKLKEEKQKQKEERAKEKAEKTEKTKQEKQAKKAKTEKPKKEKQDSVQEVKKQEEKANSETQQQINVADEEYENALNKKNSAPQEQVFTSNVKVISDEQVVINKNALNNDDEDGKVQVGFTMVDRSLISEAKDNKRYGIKERSELYKKLNSIVFYIAIPLMLIWAILAFGGVCTAKVGHTAFGNNVYYKVSEETAVTGYKNGDILTVRDSKLDEITKNSVLCIELTNATTGKKTLHLVRVCSDETVGANGTYTIMVRTDKYNETLDAVGIGATDLESNNLSSIQGSKFMGIVGGASTIIGPFLIFCQNIVAFIFIVVVPAVIILTFQFINLFDGLRLIIKQKQVGKAKAKKTEKIDKRDKIKR